MRVCVLPAVKRIELEDRPIPDVPDDFVLVKVSVCGICGSDLAAWQDSGLKKYPYTPGHEFCGVIEQVGGRISRLALGQRVVINPNLGCDDCRFCRMGRPNLCDHLKSRPIKSNGGLADYVAVDHRMARPLPDGVPDALATYVEPLSCALHIVRAAGVQPGSRIAVFGAGALGSLVGLALQPYDAEVLFIEPQEQRRARLARFLGLRVISPDELAGAGLAGHVDAAIECSGNARAVSQAVEILRKAGRLVLGGLITHSQQADVSFAAITVKELAIRGAWLNPNTFEAAMDLVSASQEALARLPTETFPLARILPAFERAASPDAPKVLVTP